MTTPPNNPSAAALPIGIDDVRAAAARLEGVAHRTPVLRSAQFDARVGAQVFFKCENLQRMGAFKFRGAYNALARFTPEQRRAGVVAFSSGNHAQAVALAARLQGMRSVIVMPADAPAAKRAATEAYQHGGPGSEVILYDRWREDREAICRALAEERGLTIVPPYDHVDVMAGQGTAALELVEQAGPLDALLAPLGGGGLLSGCAVVMRALVPSARVFGVEPEAGNDVQQSLAAGRIVAIDTPRTIADGAQTQACGRLTFAVMRACVDAVHTAGDDALVDAMRFFAERMKLVVEPTGCLGAAALLRGRPELRGLRIGVVLSGGNVDLARYAGLLSNE